MKENAKLYKAQGERKSFSLSKRLADDDQHMRPEEAKQEESNKRKKGNDGRPINAGGS
jgi:hypothetical protein